MHCPDICTAIGFPSMSRSTRAHRCPGSSRCLFMAMVVFALLRYQALEMRESVLL
jgi:hypothetical protein